MWVKQIYNDETYFKTDDELFSFDYHMLLTDIDIDILVSNLSYIESAQWLNRAIFIQE